MLTNPQLVIETFGMTTLEAITDALPVIVPTEGGIAELVEDGMNGYKTDVQQLDLIEKQIKTVLEDANLYRTMARKAYACSQWYDSEQANIRIQEILTNE